MSMTIHEGLCWPLCGDRWTAYWRKNTVFWDVPPCRSCVNRCFGETYGLHLQKMVFLIVTAVKTSNPTQHIQRLLPLIYSKYVIWDVLSRLLSLNVLRFKIAPKCKWSGHMFMQTFFSLFQYIEQYPKVWWNVFRSPCVYLLSICLSVCLSLFCCSHLKHGASVKCFFSLQFLNIRRLVGLLQFLNIRRLVGLLGRGISPSQGRFLHRITQTQNKRKHPYLEWDSNSRSQCSSEQRHFMP
jgi:hypothetical protein